MAAEARIAAGYGEMVLAGGGTPEGAADAASRLVLRGAGALVSFGLAGGLDPALRPGCVILPSTVLADGRSFATDPGLAGCFGGLTAHLMLAGRSIATDAAAKAALHRSTGAHAIDLESGSVAEVARVAGLPFIVVRAICDPAERDLPPAALLALDGAGRIGLKRIFRSLLQQPGQIRGLLMLASDAARARRALLGRIRDHGRSNARTNSGSGA